MPTAPFADRKTGAHLELHLRPTLFIPELKSRKKFPALEEMVAHLAEQKVARQAGAVLEVLRQREALGSTGIGKGIAIPHGRSTMVAERAVLLARSTRGIEFDATDGNPVHLCFLIVAPPTEHDPVYLQLLAEIVKSVRLARPRQRLLEASNFDRIRTILLGQLAHE